MRYFNAAGGTKLHPEQHSPETHLIPIALDVAAGDREFLEIYGNDYKTPDGTCIRDYVHVSDLAEAHVLSITALEEQRHILVNLGSGTGSSIYEVIDMAQYVTGKKINIRQGERRKGDPAIAVANSHRAFELLRWQPKRSDLKNIISDAWNSRW